MTRLLLLALLAAPPVFGLDVSAAVYGIDGMPVEGATITAYLPEATGVRDARLLGGKPRPALGVTETAADGSFSFEDLPDLVVELAIDADGFAPHLLRTFPGDVPLTAVVQPAGLRRGQVTSAGKPVADAIVIWRGAQGAEYAARTDASGHYQVPHPSVWAHEPTVLHPKHETRTGSPRGGEQLDLELESMSKAARTGSGIIDGIVTLDGKPFPGAPVVLQPQTNEYEPAIRVVADGKGAFRASGLRPLRYAVFSGEGLEPRVRPVHGSAGGIEPEPFATADLRNETRVIATLALRRAAMITGLVVDHENVPVRNALVQIVPAGQTAHGFISDLSSRTDADGRYALAAPSFDQRMEIEIVVSPPGASETRSEKFLVAGNRVVNVTLPRQEPVPVRVIDESGKAVPNALVAFTAAQDEAPGRDVTMLVHQPFAARAVRTSEAGVVTLDLAAGAYDFAAVAEGFQAHALHGAEVRDGSTITLQLVREQLIRGRVHRAGEGVAGARVMIVGGATPRMDSGEVTAADGTFEFDGLARGTYRVMISKPEELISHSAEVEAPGTLDLDLPPAGTLILDVLDGSTGEPVREFAWTVEPLEGGPGTDRAARRHREGQTSGGASTGSATMRVSAAAYRVSVGSTGFAPTEPREVRVIAGEESRIEFRLGRGAVVSGRVLDESGLPVADAAVFAMTGDGREMTAPHPRVRPSHAQTGADGSYSLTGLTPGEVTIGARKEGLVPLRKVVRVDGITSLDLTLSRGLSIEGIVTRGGRPLADVNVGAMTAAAGGDHQSATTDGDGRFTIRGLVPGRYTIVAYSDETQKEVHGVDPSQQRRIAITLDPEVRGIVYGTVRGIAPGLEKITRRIVFVQGRNRGAEGAIDEAGNYRIEDAPTGEVFLTASIEAASWNRTSSRVAVSLEPGVPARIDLDLSRNIVVRGRATYEGAPLASARVVFSSLDNTYSSATTSADGVYEIALPGPGVYQINAHAERIRMTYYQTIREIDASTTIDIDVRELTLRGEVVDAVTRQPIAGAVVTLTPSMAGVDMRAGETMSGPDGRFELSTSAAGAHNLVVAAPGYAHTLRAVSLDGVATPPMVLELSAAEPLIVRVVDARSGTPLEAHLAIASKDGVLIPANGRRSMDGTESSFSLAPGSYRVTAIVEGYGEKSVDITAPGVIEIRM